MGYEMSWLIEVDVESSSCKASRELLLVDEEGWWWVMSYVSSSETSSDRKSVV